MEYAVHIVDTVKKRLATFPSPAGMSLTKPSLCGRIKLFPPRESLVSGIPFGDGNAANFFYGVVCRGKCGGKIVRSFFYRKIAVFVTVLYPFPTVSTCVQQKTDADFRYRAIEGEGLTKPSVDFSLHQTQVHSSF